MHIKYLVSAAALLSSVSFTQAYAHDMPPPDKMQEAMQQADTNKDGKISYDEFKVEHEKRGQERFKKMDANSDGFIDESEKKAFHDQMREHRQEMKGKMKGDRPADPAQSRPEPK
jgi:Ca2+-binding EF-hand superfamily protein